MSKFDLRETTDVEAALRGIAGLEFRKSGCPETMAVILDLEDAVLPQRQDLAREAIAR